MTCIVTLVVSIIDYDPKGYDYIIIDAAAREVAGRKLTFLLILAVSEEVSRHWLQSVL